MLWLCWSLFLQSVISGIPISCAIVYVFLTYFLRIFPLTSYIQMFVCLFVDCVLDYFKLNEIHCFHFINPTLDSQDKPYLDIVLATFFVLPYLCTKISWSLSHLMQWYSGQSILLGPTWFCNLGLLSYFPEGPSFNCCYMVSLITTNTDFTEICPPE